MIRFSLVISGVPMDLYQDETIQLTRQVKDYTDLSLVYTDFTQDFTIPATDTNNQVFQNFYEENIVLGTWNQNTALPAEILIHGLPIFEGVVELLKVKLVDGLPSNYAIVFYGKGKKLMNDWGEKTMREVDWSAYDHLVDNSVVQSSWTGGLFAGDIIWDIKDYGKGLVYSKSNVRNNLLYDGNLMYYELRPSIKLSKLIEKLFAYGGFTLGGTLLSRPEFTNLYVTPMDSAGPYDDKFDYGEFSATNGGPVTLAVTTPAYATLLPFPLGAIEIVDNQNAWDPVNYEYTVPFNGSYTMFIELTTFTGPALQASVTVALYINNKAYGWWNSWNYEDWVNIGPDGRYRIVLPRLVAGDKIQFRYSCSSVCTFEGIIGMEKTPATKKPLCEFSECFPATKIKDFINGFLKTFNAIIVPNSTGGFDLHNIQDWYALGATKQYTDYIDTQNIEYLKVPIPRQVSFKHQDSEALPHTYFKETYYRKFGDMEFSPDVDFAEADLEIESIFTINPPTVIREVNQSGLMVGETPFQIPAIYNSDVKPVQQNYILFYYQGYQTVNKIWRFNGSILTSIPMVSPFSANNTNGYSVCFGLEGNVSGNMPKNSLYLQFWNEYISRMYSTKSRIVIFTAVIPVNVWLTMNLNDTISVSGNYYKIQKITYDLLTEKAVLELMTYPNVARLTVTSTTGKRPFYLNPVNSALIGETFIKGEQVKLAIGNAIVQAGVYQTTPIDVSNWNVSESYRAAVALDYYQSVIALNKLTVYSLALAVFILQPGATPVPFTAQYEEGDTSYYQPNLGAGTITIKQPGQYRFKGVVCWDTVGNHPTIATIMVNGNPTEAFHRSSGNNMHTANIQGSMTLGREDVVSLCMYTGDGTSHPIQITETFLVIEKIV